MKAPPKKRSTATRPASSAAAAPATPAAKNAKPPTKIVARRAAASAPASASASASGPKSGPRTGRNRRGKQKDAPPAPRRVPVPERPGFVEIGYVEKSHGLEGEVRVVPHNVDTTSFARGNTLHLGVGPGSRTARTRDDALVAHKIRAVRPVPGGFLLRFETITGRDAADALRSLAVYVDRAALPPPEPGEVYASDLVDARVELVNGDVIGKVERVVDYPSVSALAVRLDDGGRVVEVPMVEAYVAEMDAEAHLVKLHHVEEL